MFLGWRGVVGVGQRSCHSLHPLQVYGLQKLIHAHAPDPQTVNQALTCLLGRGRSDTEQDPARKPPQVTQVSQVSQATTWFQVTQVPHTSQVS